MIPEIIIKEVNLKFNCDILSTSRLQKNVFGRIAFAKYSRIINPNISTTKIGSHIGKDHATILHYFKQHESLYKYDKDYRNNFNSLTLNNGQKRWLCKEMVYEKVQ